MEANSTPEKSESRPKWTSAETRKLEELLKAELLIDNRKEPEQRRTWAQIWELMSLQLKDHGYYRKSSAIKDHWQKTKGPVGEENSQASTTSKTSGKSTPGAAKKKWSDIEHQLFFKLVDAQCALEGQDTSNEITWAQLFALCSLNLQQHGYKRTPKSCGDYYMSLRGPVSDIVYELSAEVQIDDDHTVQEIQQDPEAHSNRWTVAEKQKIRELFRARREFEKNNQGEMKLLNLGLGAYLSTNLQQYGFSRTAEACRKYVQNHGAEFQVPLPKRQKYSEDSTSSAGKGDENIHPRVPSQPFSLPPLLSPTLPGAVEEALSTHEALQNMMKSDSEDDDQPLIQVREKKRRNVPAQVEPPKAPAAPLRYKDATPGESPSLAYNLSTNPSEESKKRKRDNDASQIITYTKLSKNQTEVLEKHFAEYGANPGWDTINSLAQKIGIVDQQKILPWFKQRRRQIKNKENREHPEDKGHDEPHTPIRQVSNHSSYERQEANTPIPRDSEIMSNSSNSYEHRSANVQRNTTYRAEKSAPVTPHPAASNQRLSTDTPFQVMSRQEINDLSDMIAIQQVKKEAKIEELNTYDQELFDIRAEIARLEALHKRVEHIQSASLQVQKDVDTCQEEIFTLQRKKQGLVDFLRL